MPRIISLVLDIFLSAAVWNHDIFSNTDMLTAFLFWSDILLQIKPCIFKHIPKKEGSGCALSLISPTCDEFQHDTRHWWSFQPNWQKAVFIPMLWSWRILTRMLHSLCLVWRMGSVWISPCISYLSFSGIPYATTYDQLFIFSVSKQVQPRDSQACCSHRHTS